MSSPNRFDGEEDATLHKAKQLFIKHLEEVDTSEGLANTLVLKFYLNAEVEAALNSFVTDLGCSMESRIISREEQDKIDKRRKTCSQFTWFMVTPEAQEEYLKNRKSPLKRPAPKSAATRTTPAKPPRTPKKKVSTPAIKKLKETPESEEPNTDEDSETLTVPRAKIASLCSRLADAMLLLPRDTAGIECRNALFDVAHDMRELLPLKRVLIEEDEGEVSGASPRRAKKPRVSRS
ncbi:hypothetical protein DFH09DRAFT_1151925 [Mycena vulgaris]|nr:hypothetical protein DFH09DRAFT_1151925 [Mycena vulgaris]